jgi:hypothetical protein
LLAGTIVWSIERGGGAPGEVVCMMLSYARGCVDVRWLIVPGIAGFFGVTKPIHSFLYGHFADSGRWGAGRSAHEEPGDVICSAVACCSGGVARVDRD